MDFKHKVRLFLYAQSVCTGVMIFGYNQGVFNPTYLPVATALNWGTQKVYLYGIFQGMYPMGAIIGSSIASSIWSKYGRRMAMLCISVLFFCGGILSSANYEAPFGMGRIISGTAGGMAVSIAPSYIMEFCPLIYKRYVGLLIQLNISFGIFLSYLLGIGLPATATTSIMNHWWQFMFLFPSILAILLFILFKFVCRYDSPAYYLTIGDEKMSREAVAYVVGDATDNSALELNNQVENPIESIIPSYKELFFTRKYFYMFRIVVILQVLEQLTATPSITAYSTKIFNSITTNITLARQLTMYVGLGKFVATFFSFALMRFLGRKTVLIIGLFGIMVFHLIFSLILEEAPNASPYIPMFIIMLDLAMYTCAYGPVLYVYLGESLIHKFLPVGSFTKFSINLIINFVFPIAQTDYGNAVVFFFFAICMAVGGIYAIIDLTETRGKTREEILAEFMGTKKVSTLE